MNTTSTPSYRATLRSLFCSFRFIIVAFAISLYALMLCASVEASEDARSTQSTNILRHDILKLVGPVTEWTPQESLPEAGFLIRLNRRAGLLGGTPYGMVVRGMDSVENALLHDAQDGKWDRFSLFQAALVVEGIRDAHVMRRYENRLDAVLAGVGAASSKAVTPEVLTRHMFEALHREVLTKPYDIDCTELGKVFETGHFNCVSATVLFNVLAEKAGLDVCALEMPGHALSRVKLAGASSGSVLNVETTCPEWFSLQSEAARLDATLSRVAVSPAAVTAAAAQPVSRSADNEAVEAAAALNHVSEKSREITPVQLIATIYYNQGVDFHAEERYAEAALANIKALHLDPQSETAWGNLMAAMNNWAIKIVTETKRYDLAATLLDQGVYLDPNYDKFKANQLHVYYHWIHELACEGRKDDAKTVFALADRRLPGDKDLANLMHAIGN